MRCLGRAHWTEEDYKLAYAIKQGWIHVPTGPLWDPKSYLHHQNEAVSIRRGLFNPRRWHTAKDGKRLRKENDPFPDLPGGINVVPDESKWALPRHITNMQDDALSAPFPM